MVGVIAPSRRRLAFVLAALVVVEAIGCRNTVHRERLLDPELKRIVNERVVVERIELEGPEKAPVGVVLSGRGGFVLIRFGSKEGIVMDVFDQGSEKTVYRDYTIGQYTLKNHGCEHGHYGAFTYVDTKARVGANRLQILISNVVNGKEGEDCYHPQPTAIQTVPNPEEDSMRLMKQIIDLLLR